MLVWLTQLGLSVAAPLCGFVLLAVLLRNSLGWGSWVLWAGIGLGIYCSVTGFISTLRTLSRLSSDKKREKGTAVSFNDHD